MQEDVYWGDGLNLYACCENNPVTYYDPSGYEHTKNEDSVGNANGDVIDPVTKKVMDKSEPWDMGHKPGYEFRKHQQSAENRGISRKTIFR